MDVRAITPSTTVRRLADGPLVSEAIALGKMTMPWQAIEPPTIPIDDLFVVDRWRGADSDALRRFDLDPQTARFFGWTIEQAQAKPERHYDGGERERMNLREWQEGTRLSLAIRRRSDGEAVGWVELRRHGDTASVSYMVAAGLRGQGIASRGLGGLLAWSAKQIGLRHFHLVCDVHNPASRRVAEKCGFTLLGEDGDNYQFELVLDPTTS
jgi:RimJ/RimL family protein N-acetyltransferase